MTSIDRYCLWIECSEKVLILVMFCWMWECEIKDVSSCCFNAINWIFWLSSMERFIYKGLIAFLGGLVVIFDVVGSGEMLDFIEFYRSAYRSEKWGFRRLGVDGTHSLDFKNRNDS